MKDDSGSGLLRYRASGKRDASFGAGGALAFLSSQIETNDVVLAPDGTALAAQAVAGTFTVARFVVGQPALAATAQRPRICRLTVGAKTVARVVRTRSEDEPSLPTKLLITRPAELRVEAAAARSAGPPSSPDRLIPSAMSPPVEVPATRSKRSAAGRPVSRSSSVSTSAGMMPRMPPPSTERMRTRGAIV